MSVSPLSPGELLSALRAEGVRVRQYRSWRTHNRNHKGAWGPVNGVMLHHTVTSGTDSTVELCYSGHSTLPGPLCHGVIAKDGTCYLVGHGRANHAGGGDPDVLRAVAREDYGATPPTPREHQGSAGATDGNAHFYGFECINLGDGNDPWPEAQVDAMVRACAALLRAHGWGAKSVIGHLEWSDWKVDPRPSPGGADVAMPAIRARVAERLRHPADWNENSQEVSALAELDWDEVQRIAEASARKTALYRDETLRETRDARQLWEDAASPWHSWGYRPGGHKRTAHEYVADTHRTLSAVRGELAALRTTVDKLVDTVGRLSAGHEVDLGELREGIQAAIRDEVTRLQVDFVLEHGEPVDDGDDAA